MQLQLQELNPTATIKYDVHMKKYLGSYIMILEGYLLHELGLGFNFLTKMLSWHDASITMKIAESTVIESFSIEQS